jgi:hypothetical protein
MALKYEVTSLDSVPEPFRGEYVEADGKFRLNVSGLDDTRALKAAHERVKNELREHKAIFKDHPDLKPDDVRVLVADKSELLATRTKRAWGHRGLRPAAARRRGFGA